jgi:hypothetical protein
VVIKYESNAFIPEEVMKSKKDLILLYIKFIFITLLILGMIYLIAIEITIVRNQGGYKKAIFWIILVAISLFENYVIFHPILCYIKTKLLINYGSFDTFSSSICSLRTWLYALFITDIDRAIYKELCEIIKMNSDNYEEDKDVDIKGEDTIESKQEEKIIY